MRKLANGEGVLTVFFVVNRIDKPIYRHPCISSVVSKNNAMIMRIDTKNSISDTVERKNKKARSNLKNE